MTTKNLKNFNTFMEDVQSFLSNSFLVLCKESRDGRVNSQKDEDIIIEKLQEKYSDYITVPPARYWYDIKHKHTNTPINIKSTSLSGSDNASNFLALLHCFTDIQIEDTRGANKSKDWKQLINWVKDNQQNIKNNNRDYWFLVVDKNNTKNVFWNSLKKLPAPTGNPSNMPFQVDWRKNKDPKHRTHNESLNLYLDLVITSIKKIVANWGLDEALEIRNVR